MRELVIRARDGDRDAFSVLASRSIGQLTGVARLILRDEHAAQDAVQDAFIEAWRSLPGLRDPDRFEAWLRRLLVRACSRGARRTRRIGALEIRLTPADEPATEGGATDFGGTWTTTDPVDGSTMYLAVAAGDDPILHFVDAFATGDVCAADAVKVFTADGTGTIDGDHLTTRWPDGGGCGLMTGGFPPTFSRTTRRPMCWSMATTTRGRASRPRSPSRRGGRCSSPPSLLRRQRHRRTPRATSSATA
jgi:hypothetical protein